MRFSVLMVGGSLTLVIAAVILEVAVHFSAAHAIRQRAPLTTGRSERDGIEAAERINEQQMRTYRQRWDYAPRPQLQEVTSE